MIVVVEREVTSLVQSQVQYSDRKLIIYSCGQFFAESCTNCIIIVMYWSINFDVPFHCSIHGYICS